jgi:hypothetical protein
LNLYIPTKLSPFLEDPSLPEYPPVRHSRSLLSVFDPPETEKRCLNRSEFVTPQSYFRSYISHESEFKLKPNQLKQFSLETLFYCFYQLPTDLLQGLSAQELSNRGWAFHAEHKLWFKFPASEGRGITHFDPVSWEIKPFPNPLHKADLVPASRHVIPPSAFNFNTLKSGPPRRFPAPFSPQAMPYSQGPPVTPTSLNR